MEVKIAAAWKNLLQTEFDQPYFESLAAFVKSEYARGTVFPKPKDIFAAFDACPPSSIKIVILGQDPYHGQAQAHGLCFSVPDGVAPPPSLLNIFAEIKADLGKPQPPNGNLTRWAEQGVFLLNATLTVRADQAGSHQNRGWETFTDRVIQILAQERENLVFLLWGAYAGRKAELIPPARHLILKAPHPSPLSAHRGFFGCRHFSQANAYLKTHGQSEIDW